MKYSGDAAGYTDPVVGQGLSIALRDARLVRDAITSCAVWDTSIFTHYCDERRERIRRTICGTRLAAQPELGGLLAAAFIGWEKLPPEVITLAFYERIFGA